MHDPVDIEICADPFVRESTLPLFIEAIGNFKLASCQCFREADRPVLINKVSQYYKSVEGFEQFLKFTAIALFVRCTAQRRSAKCFSALEPWRHLAEKQGFRDLALKVEDVMNLLPRWREDALKNVKGGGTRDVQTDVFKHVEAWFKAEMVPLILNNRKDPLNPKPNPLRVVGVPSEQRPEILPSPYCLLPCSTFLTTDPLRTNR